MKKNIETKIWSHQPLIMTMDSGLSENEIDSLCSINIKEPSYLGIDALAENNHFRSSKTFIPEPKYFIAITEKIIKTINSIDNFNFNVNQCEDLQLTRYDEGDFFNNHFDFFNTDIEVSITNNDRIATAILYITDDYEGGETTFPELNLAIKGKKGELLFFYYPSHLSKNQKQQTIHSGQLVTKGIKIIGSQWIKEYKI